MSHLLRSLRHVTLAALTLAASPALAGSLVASYGYELFRGGVRVAAGDLEGGVAPFVLEGLERFDTAHTATPRAMPHGEQIEIHSWSFGSSGWTATFDHGGALAVDGMVVRVREPASSLRTRLGATTARAGGVAELRVGNEDVNVPAGAPLAARVVPTADGASIDMWTTGVGTVDVHGVTIAASPTLTARTTVFEAPAGGMVRLRTRRDGGAFGPWSTWASHGQVVSGNPAAADQAIDEYQLELQPAAGTPTIATHGYIKIKKLNSGG